MYFIIYTYSTLKFNKYTILGYYVHEYLQYYCSLYISIVMSSYVIAYYIEIVYVQTFLVHIHIQIYVLNTLFRPI